MVISYPYRENRGQQIVPENTHRWGKDHCTAGLQFNKTGTDQWRKYYITKSIDGALRIQTRDCMMVGTSKSTEL